ncbi:MAG: 3-deoxy-8-phosphooctulonate synthase [Saprospiraceae bacterium]|jgi:2-dehydro-3-deoxyphosphooctonate aldolase (KDO 8-P synthase)|nr:3-deoxy-8-phosphooctulonate synthase [Saprospiraceae bacterium]MBP7920930.1 3-deoxy-8-phosphooctulonate synthase [Saprospiraceae bacterium]MBP8096806.1 3-deoxy-8-phosphooctulonate synthase [Saprospiraceae bacterium]MBP8941712.1 3-deoxy-8-phosphooctulonate synthase [Saprospiraceae bacterium]MBP9744630.1 3-deoxy-8-phosphooctulonate synthase [Saprospiraceae bacterium]
MNTTKYYSSLKSLKHPSSNMFLLIAGPCVIESKELLIEVVETILPIVNQYQIPFIFKSSYRKANRSSKDSFTGLGDEVALEYLQFIKEQYNLPVLTDIHTEEEAYLAANYVDVLQIPAFLCRQTSLLEAAADTGKAINIKKGQFMGPEAMKFAVDKVTSRGNNDVWLTERGTTFGYQDLVVDMRSIPIMQSLQVPVILDVTHSLQKPNQVSGVTGGHPQMIQTIASAGIAAGADGLFIETHPNPSVAKSDGANMLALPMLEQLLQRLVRIREAIIK